MTRVNKVRQNRFENTVNWILRSNIHLIEKNNRSIIKNLLPNKIIFVQCFFFFVLNQNQIRIKWNLQKKKVY